MVEKNTQPEFLAQPKQDSDDEDSYDPNRYYEWTEEMTEKAELLLTKEPESSFQPMIQRRLEIDAQRNWDIFYRHNTTNFYKDRHYLVREFSELSSKLRETQPGSERVTLLDLGCGVGNAFWPLIEQFGEVVAVQCCDFSKKAVGFVQANKLFNPNITASTCDLVKEEIPFEPKTAQFSQLIFVLSAIAPQHFTKVAQKIFDQLSDESVLYFRDYGKYDLAMLRFAERGTSKIETNFYVRNDKTRAYYFTTEQVQELFESVGFQTIECKYFKRVVVNRKDEKVMHRVWIQGKFRKTSKATLIQPTPVTVVE